MSEKLLEYYLSLAYSVTLDPDPEGGYVAHIKDLPGCFTQNSDPHIRSSAARDLGDIGASAKSAIPHLIALLKGKKFQYHDYCQSTRNPH